MNYKVNSPANSVDWVTPPEIIQALGAFDLDPCCPETMPWKTAKTMISLPGDGLSIPWVGRVWLNPPYGKAADTWLERLAQHGNGIALVPAATETKRFAQHVWPHASGVCFIKGRLRFYRPDGTRPQHSINQPCCLVAYDRDGTANLKALTESNLGAVVTVGAFLRNQQEGGAA